MLCQRLLEFLAQEGTLVLLPLHLCKGHPNVVSARLVSPMQARDLSTKVEVNVS
jgi:hypothetical protein